jgi:hypothetical protein
MVNDILETMWNEVFVACFGVLLWNLPGGAVESHEKLQGK